MLWLDGAPIFTWGVVGSKQRVKLGVKVKNIDFKITATLEGKRKSCNYTKLTEHGMTTIKGDLLQPVWSSNSHK